MFFRRKLQCQPHTNYILNQLIPVNVLYIHVNKKYSVFNVARLQNTPLYCVVSDAPAFPGMVGPG